MILMFIDGIAYDAARAICGHEGTREAIREGHGTAPKGCRHVVRDCCGWQVCLETNGELVCDGCAAAYQPELAVAKAATATVDELPEVAARVAGWLNEHDMDLQHVDEVSGRVLARIERIAELLDDPAVANALNKAR
jgi:hypothetical protein